MNANEFPHAELVSRAKNGDRDAFYELVKQYQKMVWRQCIRAARKVEIADELTQQVFLKAFTHVKSFREDAPFGAWLFRIAFNITLDWRRSKKNVEMVDIEEVNPATEGLEETSESIDRERKLKGLREAIETLPEKQRKVVLLRIYEDFSFKEIAATVGGSEGTAKVNFHYGLKGLKAFMKAREKGG